MVWAVGAQICISDAVGAVPLLVSERVCMGGWGPRDCSWSDWARGDLALCLRLRSLRSQCEGQTCLGSLSGRLNRCT